MMSTAATITGMTMDTITTITMTMRMASIAITKVLERMPAIRKLEPTVDWLPSLWIRGARTLHVSA